VNAANLIQKIYFPRLLLPVATIAGYLLDLAIALVVLGLLIVALGAPISLRILWLVPLSGLALMTSLGAGIWLAAVNVRYRDVRYAVPFIVQVLLFVTPVAYSPDLVPASWHTIYELNPMAGVVEGFRWAVLGGPLPTAALGLSVAVSAAVLFSGLVYFRRVERTFADVI
jgi:lipopolysaccharide transport system permease protein